MHDDEPRKTPLFTAIVVGYIVSRAIAKAGSREGPFQFEGRDGEGQ